MNDAFDIFKNTFSDVYEVVRTVDLVRDGNYYRIEVVRVRSASTYDYTAHYWQILPIKVEPGAVEYRFTGHSHEVIDVLRRVDFPAVRADNPDWPCTKPCAGLKNKPHLHKPALYAGAAAPVSAPAICTHDCAQLWNLLWRALAKVLGYFRSSLRDSTEFGSGMRARPQISFERHV